MRRFFAFMMIALCAVFPAHAATNTGSFPNDGKMLEDWTYTNAANETNVGVDGGNVNALANYTWNEIALPAGKYLPADTDGLIANLLDCTSGNYCAGTGANTVHYNQSQPQGLTACPSGYGNSATGATADTDCYRTCDINNMTTTSNPNGTIANIAHATQLTGNDYYGNGNDTCEPTECDTGYHIQNTATYSSATGTGSQSGTPTPTNPINPVFYRQGDMVLRAVGSYADSYDATTGKITRRVGVKVLDGTENWGIGSTVPSLFLLDIPDAGSTADFAPLCTHFEGTTVTNLNMQNGQIKITSVGALRIKDTDYTTVAQFTQYLADQYANGTPVTIYYPLATAVEENVLAICEPNTYNITWADTLAADVTANEAATATYGGNINTPVKIDPAVFQTTQKGKRFIGWTFGAPKYDFSQLDYTIEGNSYTHSAANRTWTTTFNYGVVSGVSLCSVTPGTYARTGSPDETTTGEEAYYCWCRATGYTPAGENIVYENTSSSPWVFIYAGDGSASSCASHCAYVCGYRVQVYSDFRRAVFGITNN